MAIFPVGIFYNLQKPKNPYSGLADLLFAKGPTSPDKSQKRDNTNWRACGPGGLAVFPNEKRELSACWRGALKTEGRAGGLHKKAVWQVAEKGRAGCRKG